MGALHVTCVDGLHARLHLAELTIANDVVLVTGDTFERRAPIGALEITDAIGSAPRLVRFPDGACCEPIDRTAFDDALAAAGIGHSRLSAWERSPAWMAASLLALVVVLTFGYRVGLPAMARVVADRLPDAAVERLSRQLLLVLDRTLFDRTNLSASTSGSHPGRLRSAAVACRGRRTAI